MISSSNQDVQKKSTIQINIYYSSSPPKIGCFKKWKDKVLFAAMLSKVYGLCKKEIQYIKQFFQWKLNKQ